MTHTLALKAKHCEHKALGIKKQVPTHITLKNTELQLAKPAQ
jgi:hypothetical protein